MEVSLCSTVIGEPCIVMETWENGTESGYAIFYDVSLAVKAAILLSGEVEIIFCDDTVRNEYIKQTAK